MSNAFFNTMYPRHGMVQAREKVEVALVVTKVVVAIVGQTFTKH